MGNINALRSALLLAPAFAALACNPDLPFPVDVPGADGELSLTLDPPAPLDAAPPVLRLRVALAGAVLDPARVVLVSGSLGPAHLRQLQRGEPSKALSKRIIPALIWSDAADEAGEAVVVAPTAPLVAGELYAIAAGDPPTAIEIRITAADPAPFLPRIWPPEGGAATAALGVWCGDDPLPALDVAASLEPGGPAGSIRRGAFPGASGTRCLHFTSAAPGDSPSDPAWVGVPPPSVAVPDALGGLRLDPRPFSIDAEGTPIAALACEPGEVPFGPGCVVVADDRLYGRSPEAALLWIVSGEGVDRAFAAAPGEPFVIAGLTPEAAIALDVTAVDDRGEASTSLFTATTAAPMPHVILNEVLANPIGAEPMQEWVEIYNDGSAPADLSGYALIDIGGETLLPAEALAAGAFALIVNESFASDDEYDPAPAPGTLLLSVPKLGKNGLANMGEPLKLCDAEGNVVSRFSAASKPKAGFSLARLWPGAPDGISSSFAPSVPTPGGPNGPSTTRAIAR